ncbi:hypothetical protein K1T71_001317 [Dendrolimus kikuchii]|uniref:Uncharacterized protein n=1 Tax=Dendrolimus kikuchii TaxID=765133 RepID=A0ACC1DHH2_9NEOP|nr:hypothetical protein K1T71_001317 [Dendrolimus kikuchii]
MKWYLIFNEIRLLTNAACKGLLNMTETQSKDIEDQKINEDPVTKIIGAIGKWQIWICCVVFLVKFPVAWHQMSIIFLAPPMNFTCSSNFGNSTEDFDSKCYANCSDYSYDHSVFQETIISQWNLVCERQWLKNLTQTIFMLGILVGNMMFGHLSDRYGRRLPFLAAVFLQLISGVTTAYSVNWYMFTTLRFFLAVATGGTMVTSFVLIMELIGAKYRDTVGIIYQIPFNLGHLTLPLFGYYLRDWNMFQLAISLPSVLFLSYYFLLPESPRWLLTAGKAEEAAKILETVAKRNGLPTENITTTTQKMVVGINSKPEEHASFLSLFRTPRLRARTIAICFNWFVCGLCFFGVSQYIGHVSGNIFTNVAISAAIQVPGTLISVYANRALGRKITLISSNCVTGLSCLLIIVVPSSGASNLTLGCIGLWGLSISFATVYLYAGELFPTVVRNTGVGLSSTVARIGSMLAPFVATLSTTSAWLPPLAFGIVPLIGAALCIILPDTRGKKLPDTLEEGEATVSVEENDDRRCNRNIEYICLDENVSNATNYCPCENPEYDQSTIVSSVTSEWDLICGRTWLASLAQSIMQIGILAGSLVFGFISDRYGRKNAALLAHLLVVASIATSGLIPELWTFFVCRFLIGVALGGTMITFYVILIELCGKSFRHYLVGLIEIAYITGYFMLPIIAYYVREWRYLQLVTSVPWILVIVYYWIMPESPRWLISVGRKEEAVKILTYIAKKNNRPLENIADVVESIENEKQPGSYVDLFKTPKIRKYTIINAFIWMFCAHTFFGVNQYIGRLQGNLYVNVMLSAACLAPGLVLVVLATLYCRRKISVVTSFIVAAVSLLITIALPKDAPSAILAFAIIGQIGAYTSFVQIYLYTSEIFPTVIRNSALGFASVFARVGGFIAPFVVNIEIEWVSVLIFSSLAFCAAILCYFLPETRDTVLLNTIDETEKLSKI